MKLNLSRSAIERLIYALSALRSHYNRESEKSVPLLTADRSIALKPLIDAALGEISLTLGATLTLEGDDGATVEMAGNGGNAAAIVKAVEQGCALAVLQRANIGYDAVAAADYGREAVEALDIVKRRMAGEGTAGRIVPRWY